MTDSIRSDEPPPDLPVVVFANWFHFETGRTVAQSCVESRMLLWCSTGTGRVRVNGQWLILAFDDWLFLPWGREIIYEAALRDPFVIGAIHLIPSHSAEIPVQFEVSHQRDHPLAGSVHRRDRQWKGLEGIVHGTMSGTETLRLLSVYIIESFLTAKPHEPVMRRFAELLRHELALSTRPTQPTLPAMLRRIIEHAKKHQNENLSVGELARLQGCGEATVYRLFQTFLKTTPAFWIASQRIEAAARLLRTTNLSVEKIGKRIGIQDPFQFSRLFKKHQGASPRTYRLSQQKF